MARQIIAIGSTGAELVSAFNINSLYIGFKVFNVEDYGAVHDNTTDDTVAIQAAIDACATAGGGIVYFPNGIYVLNGPIITTRDGYTYDSQITLPYKLFNDQTRLCIKLLGETPPVMIQSEGIFFGNKIIPPLTGVILKSTITGSASDQYVIGGGKDPDGLYLTGNTNEVHIENIQIQIVPVENKMTIGGIDLGSVCACHMDKICISPYNTWMGDILLPTPLEQIGIRMPQEGDQLPTILEHCILGGFQHGVYLGEQNTVRDLIVECCLNGITVNKTYQMNLISRVSAFWNANTLNFVNARSMIKIDCLQVEWEDVYDKFYDNQYIINDPSSYGIGEIYYNITQHNKGFNNALFSKSGGTKLQCYPIAFAAASSFTVSGARNNPEAALANLITALAAKGIIIDSTTAS